MKSVTVSSELESSRPAQVLQQALNQSRLAHGILLHGNNLKALEELSLSLANQLLRSNYSSVHSHPDFFVLRPSNKMRQINAADTRELISNIQKSPNQAERKAALVYEADRMNLTAANAFLKTLEEPPLNTTIFLITSRPYSILDTIRSRCLNFRIPSTLDSIKDSEWEEWLSSYFQWVQEAQLRPKSPTEASSRIMATYLMAFQFGQILERMAQEAWESVQASLAEGLNDDQLIAQKTGVMKTLRTQFFIEIENTTHNAALIDKSNPPTQKLTQIIKKLEKLTSLIEVNLNELTALEAFFLASLRIWMS